MHIRFKDKRKTGPVIFFLLMMAGVLAACSPKSAVSEKKNLRILATGDLHGKFLPWNYASNQEDKSGSLTQLAAAIAKYRTDRTLLVDAGDTIQGNSADLFMNSEEVHPMIQGLNALDYDIWVTGNHEYDYGMDKLRKTISDLNADVLTGNVYDETGKPVADGYKIFDLDGVRVAVIGMVTPNIICWDSKNLEECKVTDPLEETRSIIDRIAGEYDLLVGVYHMGINNEFGTGNSGVTDICNACPEFDLMISSHEHKRIPFMEINGVPVVQNKHMGQTLALIDMEMEKKDGSWSLARIDLRSLDMADFPSDPALSEALKPYHQTALEDSEQVIGQLKEGPLVPEGPKEIKTDLPTAQVEDTPLIELINQVQLYYTGAKVSATALLDPASNLVPGDIHKYDVSRIYQYDNTLYKMKMNGRQLKKFMEWSVNYFDDISGNDPDIKAREGIPDYLYMIFDGVSYQVNLARPAGSRIENLTWPDGSRISDEEEFEIALNSYVASSVLMLAGEIYEENDLPVLLEMDVGGSIGGIRELIRDYILKEKKGTIRPECDHNWKIIVSK